MKDIKQAAADYVKAREMNDSEVSLDNIFAEHIAFARLKDALRPGADAVIDV